MLEIIKILSEKLHMSAMLFALLMMSLCALFYSSNAWVLIAVFCLSGLIALFVGWLFKEQDGVIDQYKRKKSIIKKKKEQEIHNRELARMLFLSLSEPNREFVKMLYLAAEKDSGNKYNRIVRDYYKISSDLSDLCNTFHLLTGDRTYIPVLSFRNFDRTWIIEIHEYLYEILEWEYGEVK